MMGSRKRAKPNPAPGPSTTTTAPTNPQPPSQPSQGSSNSSQSNTSLADNATRNVAASTLAADQSTPGSSQPGRSGTNTPTPRQGSSEVHKTRSWYGSWPRVPKSAPSTQVARETILGGTSKPTGTADFSKFDSKKPTDAMSISDEPQPAPAAPKIQADATKEGDPKSDPAPPAAEDAVKPDDQTKPEDTDTNMPDAVPEEGTTETLPGQPVESPAAEQGPALATPQRPASGWFGWLGRSPAVGAPSPVPALVPPTQPSVQEEAALATIEPPPPEAKLAEADKEVPLAQEASAPVDIPNIPLAQSKEAASSGGSWLWSWSGKSAPLPTQLEAALPAPEPQAPPPQVQEPEDVDMQDAPPVAEVTPDPPTPAPAPKPGSSWGFWSRDSRTSSSKKPAQQGEQGELAVIGETSENHPRRANSIEFKRTPVKEIPAKEPPLKSAPKDEPAKAGTSAALVPAPAAAPASTPSRESSSKSNKSNKRGRPQSMEIDDATPVRPSTPKVDTPTKATTSKTPTAAKPLPPNLLLPSFTNTYKLKENPSILKQITQLLLRTQQSSAKHVYLAKEPPKVKKAIAIGVHGLFPANYLRPMIGQPTGTSIKFANHCADSIRRWADSHGCEDCEIEKIALEGEGKIGERVENLWKLLLNWIDHIRNADLIIIACHSQGVPVSIMLLAKLIELGVVSSARVGVCAMAGVLLGPFPDYRSSMGMLMGSAAELWAFGDPQSEVSQRLEASIKAVLAYGARLTYIGSIDDQLVPVESAIYAPAHHPYIYRAVFIDGRIHAPDFIAHLVGFALKLRNLGVSDHGLIRELSSPLAGSLYSGEGHSRLYDDAQVYDLAVTHALETADLGGSGKGGASSGGSSVPCEIRHKEGAGALANPNPYHLPWIMRGLLEEDFVKTELSAETAELVRRFDEWKPVTKALKDVKYRLEAVRSKL